MNRLLLATAASVLIAGTASAQDPVNVGIILGFTGPLESITPGMAESAEFAFAEVNESGVLGAPLNPVRADSTCVDAAAATAAAERLITAENVAAILG
ncbi:ABC transporter substrate-binding protein, partial [Amaricoccus sp.]